MTKPKNKGKTTSGDLFIYFTSGVFMSLIGIYSLATGGEPSVSSVFTIVGFIIIFISGFLVCAELDAFEELLDKLEKQRKKHD